MPWSTAIKGVNAVGNLGLGIAQTVLGAKAQQQQNAYNEESLALAKEAQRAQLAQQELENEWYIDDRDYNRALQKQIFDREDTAMQRAVDDFTAAGFSPLAAVGNMAAAGSVVSSASSPGSQVSNNQPSLLSGNPLNEAVNQLSTRFDSALSRSTQMYQFAAQQEHDENMEAVKHKNAKDILTAEAGLAILEALNNHSNAMELQRLINEGQKSNIEAQGQNALDLQNDQQQWLDSQPKDRSITQIGEQFLNQLKENDPTIAELAGDAQGYEILFKVLTTEVITPMIDKIRGANPVSEDKASALYEESGITMPEGFF